MINYFDRIKEIDRLLKLVPYNYGNPTAFTKLVASSIDVDNNTSLLGNKQYRRYRFDLETKLFITIQTNARHFKNDNPLFESSVISLLFRHEGEMINPFLPADQDVTRMLKVKILNSLDAVIKTLEDTVDESIRGDSW